MFWAQAVISFGLWVGYGVLQARRGTLIRTWARQVSSALRGLWGAGLFLGGAAVMLAGLLGVASGKGLGPSGMAPWAWGLLTLVGLVFVHTQTLAMALLVVSAQEAVTQERMAASEKTESKGNSSDEAPSP